MKLSELVLKESVKMDRDLKIKFDKWDKEEMVQAYKNSGYSLEKREIDEFFTDWHFKGLNKSGDPTFAVVSLNDTDSKDSTYYVHLLFVKFNDEYCLSLDVGTGPLKEGMEEDEAIDFAVSYKLK